MNNYDWPIEYILSQCSYNFGIFLCQSSLFWWFIIEVKCVYIYNKKKWNKNKCQVIKNAKNLVMKSITNRTCANNESWLS